MSADTIEADAPVGLAQFPAKLRHLFAPARYKVAYGGRGSGKSWGYARALLIQAAAEPLRILCTREVQESIRDSVHALLTDQIERLGLGSHYQVLRDEIRGANGSRFLFAGLSDLTAESIKSFEGVDRVWCEEARSITKRSWSILIPTIRQSGSEIWATFNPELDSDETYLRFVVNPPPDCVSAELNWRDNPWFAEPLISEREHAYRVAQATGGMDDYNNIWEGKVRSAVEGAIYAREVAASVEGRRIRDVPHDTLLRTHTIWDLGWNDQTSILFVQRVGSEIRVIDYIEESHRPLSWYAQEIEKRGYRYRSNWLPHDGDKGRLESDGKSSKQLLEAMGLRCEIVKDIGVEAGIKAAREMFPRVYFDRDKAARLVECLKRYKRQINRATQEPRAPLHDEYSHGADAYRYLACVADKLTNDAPTWAPIKYDDRGIV